MSNKAESVWTGFRELPLQEQREICQQMMRWLVTGTPGPVVLTTPSPIVSDDSRVKLRAEVRDKTYTPAPDAQVEARVIGPDGSSGTVTMRPDPAEPGVYAAEYSAPVAGSYIAEAVARRGKDELGRGVAAFRREDGVAEEFHTEQNRELLERLATQTGGRYYRPADAARIMSGIKTPPRTIQIGFKPSAKIHGCG